MVSQNDDSYDLIDASKQLRDLRDSLFSQQEQATIIFIDLAGSMVYKEKRGHIKGIEKNIQFNLSVTDIIQDACSELENQELIERWEIVKYVGDEVMLYLEGSQSSEAAVQVGKKVHKKFRSKNATREDPLEQMQARIGINTGQVLFAQYQESGPSDPQGLPVDIASRLSSLAKPGQILISSEDAKALNPNDHYDLSDATKRDFKGLGEKLGVVEINWGNGYQDIATGKPSSVSAIEAAPQRVKGFMEQNDLLKGSVRIDLSLYTFETLAATIRPELIRSDEDLYFRVLIRNPKSDQFKADHIRSSVRTIREILQRNNDIMFSVRFYESPPMLRTYAFHDLESSEDYGLCGMYRYDPDAQAKFIGAEGNQMIVSENQTELEQSLLNAHTSRFQYNWERLTKDRAVIFDLDGSLIDTMPYYETAWKSAFEQFGVKNLPSKIFYEREGEQPSKTVKEVYSEFKGEEPSDEIVTAIINRLDEMIAETYTPDFFPGVQNLLGRIQSKNIKMCLVTGSENLSDKFDENTEFLNYFDEIISGADKSAVDSPQNPYSLALRNLNIGPDKALVVENAPLGIRCAVAENIPTIAINHKNILENDVLLDAGAVEVYNKFEELTSLLLLMDTNYPPEDLIEMID